MHVLAGDIGGTHTRLVMAECRGHDCRVRFARHYVSRDYPDVDAVLREFLAAASAHAPAAVCLAVAGPVRQTAAGQQVQVTNLPWVIDSSAVASRCGTPAVRLINDFEAIGYGIGVLEPSAFAVLQSGAPDPLGTRAVLGAGTGLGQVIVTRAAEGDRVLATEGGHVDFGPTSELELELARWLIAQRGRACYEDILSGPGLARLYDFLRVQGVAPESPAVARAMRAGDPAVEISRAASQDADPLAVATLDLFVQIYGAQAGNLALAAGATGGVYLAGGIAPKIIHWLRGGRFLAAFRSKGSMAPFVAAIPVQVVLDTDVGLRGAQTVAARLLQTGRNLAGVPPGAGI
jgi:glucokinase